MIVRFGINSDQVLAARSQVLASNLAGNSDVAGREERRGEERTREEGGGEQRNEQITNGTSKKDKCEIATIIGSDQPIAENKRMGIGRQPQGLGTDWGEGSGCRGGRHNCLPPRPKRESETGIADAAR